ncbi:MAG: thiamine pyrophosphate-binding protein [Deltaproteobacteria bacterium]|nr:thiamine pyrophosphate-binding protein [Deltaproteobacteria bacterium]MBW2416770.1 thiamine pyrophosphate-binding protein [Deltaproteobacteria bacterium]
MAEITGGELLARCLAREGVRFVFGLPCPEVDPLLAACEENGIRFVPVRHESAGAHMAEGLYKTTGQVAVVCGNPGPGSANLIPGVITARHEGVPMIALTSQHRLGVVYPSSPATFQGQDQIDAYAAAVKWGGPILSLDRLEEVTRMAFREMWSGRPGPVQLEIPSPVMYDTKDDAQTQLLPPSAYRPGPPQASEAQLEQAVELLAGAESPAVIAGSGVDRAEANDALLRLVELLGCPVLPTMAGRAVVPRDHPNYVYGYSAGGAVATREADVVLVAGSRLGNLDLPYDKYWGDPATQKIVQIDVDPLHVGVTRPIELGILADARDALEGLVRLLEKRGAARPPTDHLARSRAADEAWRAEHFKAVEEWAGPGVHPAQAMPVIGETFGRDAIYVADGGNTSLWAHWRLPPTQPRSYLNILELGMLGTGIPSAIGARLGSPEREVVCVTGDGAAGFNFMEMQSAAREGLKLVTIVFAEGSWSMEEPNERMRYGKTFGTAQGTIRWDTVAQGLGCQGFYAEKLEELAPALEKARACEGPAVVCLRTDLGANLSTPLDPLLKFGEVYAGPMG